MLYHCDLNDDVDAEDYIFDVLGCSSLPLLVRHSHNDLKPAQIISGIGAIVNQINIYNFLELKINVYNPEMVSSKRSCVQRLFDSEGGVGIIFVAGDKSSVGKSTTCLCLISSLIKLGVSTQDIAYIKPVTQCEEEQPITRFCNRLGIACEAIGPVVFYKGFTRAFLAGETESSSQLLKKSYDAVNRISQGKKLVVIDGVGYPAVGSICGLSNADVAAASKAPVLIIGKSGVGDAVDSYNLNASFFEHRGLKVLGGIFNKFALEGFYNLDACRSSIISFFKQYKITHYPYGFMPALNLVSDDTTGTQDIKIANADEKNGNKNSLYGNGNTNTYFVDSVKNQLLPSEDQLSDAFLHYVNVSRLLCDIWYSNLCIHSASNVATWLDVTSSTPQSSFPAPAGSTKSPAIPTLLPSVQIQTEGSLPSSMPYVSRVLSPIALDVETSGKKRSREEIEALAAAKGARGG